MRKDAIHGFPQAGQRFQSGKFGSIRNFPLGLSTPFHSQTGTFGEFVTLLDLSYGPCKMKLNHLKPTEAKENKVSKPFARHSTMLASGLVLQAATLGLLTACSGMNAHTTEDALLRGEVSEMLGESASKAGTAWRKVGVAEPGKHKPAPPEFHKEQLTSSLEKKVSFEWSGPASGAVRMIAEDNGYSFSIAGNPPSIEPNVHLLLENASVVQVLREIGTQSFPAAEVIADQNAGRIYFRFIQSGIGTLVK